MTMVDFRTSIPLMALAALASGALLLGLSVADQRRSEPVALRVQDDGRLAFTGQTLSAVAPVCIRFAPASR